MKTPKRMLPLIDEGWIDEVICQLMSGKEANVYLVRSHNELRCAKVYKERDQRSFHQSVLYQEGRQVKNSRQARAMAKGSRYGRAMQEQAWHDAEVNALYRLAAAGVRVPKPYICHAGVLLMSLVSDAQGNPAPRLNDVQLSETQALLYHEQLIQQVVSMLCAGIIHGDLSEFNILLAADGPVIIDLPQAIDATRNNNANRMLLRDCENLANYFGRFAPQLKVSQYGREIWNLYLRGQLRPQIPLTGRVRCNNRKIDVAGVVHEIHRVQRESEEARHP